MCMYVCVCPVLVCTSVCVRVLACGLTADGEAVHVVPGEPSGEAKFILQVFHGLVVDQFLGNKWWAAVIE